MTNKFLFFLYLTGTGMATQAQTTISAIFSTQLDPKNSDNPTNKTNHQWSCELGRSS
jgi:hypothetical protein